MALADIKESWSSQICNVKIGATAEEGGTRTSVVEIGGESTLPFLEFEGAAPNKPVIAMEVLDLVPDDWPETLTGPLDGLIGNPVEWARKCVEEYKAEMICLKLQKAHPDFGNAPLDESVKLVKDVLDAVGVPLIVWGSDDDEKDNQLMPLISEAAKGEKCLLGTAKEDNYKTITAACIADGHNLMTESPLDINIAKQVNILVSDMGFDLDRVVIFPTTGGLGYGIEYAYSIQERGRLAGLSGDKMMGMPVICSIGPEAWRAKEAKAANEEFPAWGEAAERGPMWEFITGATLLQAGADILVMRHPKAAAEMHKMIAALTGNGA
jgi:acetyl-CoA decarbonylase/synthase, CODH/ACS complex subunit delta